MSLDARILPPSARIDRARAHVPHHAIAGAEIGEQFRSLHLRPGVAFEIAVLEDGGLAGSANRYQLLSGPPDPGG